MRVNAWFGWLGMVMLVADLAVLGADLLNPLPLPPASTPAETPIPIRPPDAPLVFPGRRRAPVKPPFQWQAGDRVVLLGDRLMAREAQLGMLATRLVTEAPDRDFQVRNLAWLTNHPLAGATVSGTADWVGDLQRAVAPLKPTVIGLAYGNDLTDPGPAALDAFRSNYTRLLDALAGGPADGRPRLILFSPVGRPVAAGDAVAEAAQSLRQKLTETVEGLATNRNAEFVNLLSWVQPTAEFLKRITETTSTPYPALFDAHHELTAFGYFRAVLALERSLRWRSGTWRFGYQSDGTFREGGFGTKLLEYRRTNNWVRVKQVEEMLPMPNPAGFVDRDPNTRPQCYIQLPGLLPGLYALRVDGQEVQRASDAEWGRYQIIADGPSWKQVEGLRQLIVRQNERLATRWGPDGAARNATESVELTPFTDPDLAALDRQIAQARKPVPRVYEVVRVGNAPGAKTTPPAAAGQPIRATGTPTIPVVPAK